MPRHPLLPATRLFAAALATAALGTLALPASATEATTESTAEAAPAITWSLSPAQPEDGPARHWLEVELAPGQTVREELVVKNHSEQPVTFAIQAADGYFTDTGRFNMLASDQPSAQSGTWIQVPEQIQVTAGGQEEIPVTITAPHNATPGDHAAGVAAVISDTSMTGSGASVGLESRVGVRVMTRVNGPVAPSLGLADATAGYTQSWNPFTPGSLDVDFTAHNTGNLQLETGWSVAAPLAGEAGSERGLSLLPGDQSAITVRPATAWPLLLMPVDLQATGVDPSGEHRVSEQTRIWVWALPLPQLAVLAGIGLCLWGLRRRKARHGRELERMLDEARQQGAHSARAAATPTQESVS